MDLNILDDAKKHFDEAEAALRSAERPHDEVAKAVMVLAEVLLKVSAGIARELASARRSRD